MKNVLLLILIIVFGIGQAQILPERERAQLRDEILADRFNNLLPKLMELF